MAARRYEISLRVLKNISRVSAANEWNIFSTRKEKEYHFLSMICLSTFSLKYLLYLQYNRPVALRGHVTNASLKRWVGILLMPKIDRAHKNYLTPEIWEEKHLREIFYGTLIFQQSSTICIGRHVGGHTLASNMAAYTTFCLYLVKRLIVTLRCDVNVATSYFQHFPWTLSAKFGFWKM